MKELSGMRCLMEKQPMAPDVCTAITCGGAEKNMGWWRNSTCSWQHPRSDPGAWSQSYRWTALNSPREVLSVQGRRVASVPPRTEAAFQSCLEGHGLNNLNGVILFWEPTSLWLTLDALLQNISIRLQLVSWKLMEEAMTFCFLKWFLLFLLQFQLNFSSSFFKLFFLYLISRDFPSGSMVKNKLYQETWVRSLGGDPQEKKMATNSSIPGKSHGQRILGGYSPWGH